MDKEYFTPNIEDIRIGYQFEYKDNEGKWKHYKFETLRTKERDRPYLDYETILSIIHDFPDEIRTPYLTKEEIEAEGWKYSGKSIDIWFEKEGSFEMGSWIAYRVKLQYGLHDRRLRIFVIDTDNTEYDCFRGMCPSINEFRYINKLLGIDVKKNAS